MKFLVPVLCLFFTVCYCKPVTVTEDNWSDILEGEWMLEFMAPWCPACRSFAETWNKFSDWNRDLDIKVGVVDVTTNPGLSGRFLVASLPTIYQNIGTELWLVFDEEGRQTADTAGIGNFISKLKYRVKHPIVGHKSYKELYSIKDGVFRQYKGSRKESDLISYIDDKKWQEVEEIAWYISPSSIQMAAVGHFFKAAMVVRSIYNSMTQDYGIPEWACYIIFAIATILTGLILGLVIVLCCDTVFPYKQQPYQPLQQKTTQEEGQGDADKENEDNDSDNDIIDDMKPAETTLDDKRTDDKDGNSVPRQRRVRKDN